MAVGTLGGDDGVVLRVTRLRRTVLVPSQVRAAVGLRERGEQIVIARDAKVINRHRNPLGIFSRVFVYPIIAVGAWQHRPKLMAAGVVSEALLWTVVPPVEQTFGFIEDAIETELEWANAPPSPQKSLSLALLALFPAFLLTGLWRRSRGLLTASAGLMLTFYLLMRRIAGRT